MSELTEFQKEYLESIRKEEKKQLAEHADTIEKFKELVASKGITLNDDNFKFYETSGIIAHHKNIVSVINQTLVRDKEGLLRFDELTKTFQRRPFSAGYLYTDQFALMAHPYFRRGYHQVNSFAPNFIDLFWGLKGKEIEKYISIDFDSIRIDLNRPALMERDMWMGAKFEKDIGSIPDNIVKLVPPPELRQSLMRMFFSDVYCLDIKWTSKNGIKTFQAEEFKTENILINKDGDQYFPVRYIHAEYDLEKKVFRHFDGAMHFYRLDEVHSTERFGF